jgi:hypothetical protein
MDAPRPVDAAPARAAAGQRLAGFTYGTLVVLAMVVVGAKAYPDDPGLIAVFVVVTTVVLWLAHVYAHGVGQSISEGKRLSFGQLGHLARREGSIVEAALPPVVPLLLGALDLISAVVAVWAAFGLGLAVLAVQGVRFAHIEGLGRIGTCAAVAVNLAFGLVLVGLKLFLAH